MIVVDLPSTPTLDCRYAAGHPVGSVAAVTVIDTGRGEIPACQACADRRAQVIEAALRKICATL